MNVKQRKNRNLLKTNEPTNKTVENSTVTRVKDYSPDKMPLQN